MKQTLKVLDDVTEFLNNEGQVAIIDGKDFSPEIRALISQRLTLVNNCSLIWIENLLESESIVNELIQLKKTHQTDCFDKNELLA